MVTTKQLSREIARLKKEERDKRIRLIKETKMLEMRKKQHAEKLMLEKKLRALKNPELTQFKKTLKGGLRKAFNVVALIGGDVDRTAKQLIKNRRMQKEREQEILKINAQSELERIKKAKQRMAKRKKR